MRPAKKLEFCYLGDSQVCFKSYELFRLNSEVWGAVSNLGFLGKGIRPSFLPFFFFPNKGRTGEEKTQSLKIGSKYDFMETTAFEITYCEHTSLQHVLTLFLCFISYPQCARVLLKILAYPPFILYATCLLPN